MNFSVTKADIKQIWEKSQKDLILTQATALAYTTLLSVIPILAVAFFIFQSFGGFEDLQDAIRPLIERNLAPSFSAQISQYLDNFFTNVHTKTIGLFGLIGFIFTSISTLATVEKTLNIIFGTLRERSWSKRIVTYWSLLTIGPLLFGVSVILSSKALAWLKMDHGFIANVLVASFEIVPYLAAGLLFTALYIFLPNISVDKVQALKAGLIAGVAFELAKIIYALYAVHAIAQNKIYGSLVVIPVFLLWLYLVWLIILFGAELCCFFQFKTMKIPYRFDFDDRLDPFIVVDIVDLLGKTQVSPKGGLTLAQLVGQLKIPMKEMIRHLDFLEKEGWVVAAEKHFLTSHKFFLTVSPDKVDTVKIFKNLEEGRYSPRSAQGQEAQGRFNQLWTNWAAEVPAPAKSPSAKDPKSN